MRHVLEEAEDKRIHRGPVLRPTLHVGCALRVVETAGRTVVGAGEGPAVLVEFETEGIAAALREDLEDLRAGMIAPDALTEQRLPLNLQRRRAAGGAVNPTVRAPVQVAGERMRVLEFEAGEMHLGVAVRDIVVVAVGIKQKVGRHQHPHAVRRGQHARRHVQSVDEGLRGLECSVAVLVLKDRDLVGPAEMPRRRRRQAVELGADVLVVRGHRKSGGKRILQVLHDPQPAARVEADINRLAHGGLARDEFDHVAVGGLQALGGLLRGANHGLAGKVLTARFEVFHELLQLRREARRRRLGDQQAGGQGKKDGSGGRKGQAFHRERRKERGSDRQSVSARSPSAMRSRGLAVRST